MRMTQLRQQGLPAQIRRPFIPTVVTTLSESTFPSGVLVRSRGLEPPRVAPLAPQASASTNSATTADEIGARPRGRARRATGLDVTNRPRTNKGLTLRPIGVIAAARRKPAQPRLTPVQWRMFLVPGGWSEGRYAHCTQPRESGA